MKKILIIICCFTLALGVNAQANDVNKDTKIASPNAPMVQNKAIPTETLVFKKSEFDFGKIPQGKPVTHVFKFTNTGSTPLQLNEVHASCGCTTPVWNKKVVQPGGTSIITVGYNAANEGVFAKPVTITYNGNLTKQLFIKGEVWKTPMASAPQNTSLNLLKNEK